MGALKHVLIPLFAFTHFLGFYKALDPKGFIDFCGIAMEAGEEQTVREQHLIGVIMSFHLAMCGLCLAGFTKEGAHFRGVIMVWEVVFYGFRTYNAWTLGFDSGVVSKPGMAAVIAVTGVVLHSMEPGLFTKDKNKESKSS